MRKSNKAQQQPPDQQQQVLNLSIIYPGAAGIDVGSTSMYVAYQNADNIQTVAVFDAFTPDLHALSTQLKQAGVTHVAMEATGNSWMALYEVLESYQLHVTLVNARHYK